MLISDYVSSNIIFFYLTNFREVRQKSFVFVSNENFKICFRDLLTFRCWIIGQKWRDWKDAGFLWNSVAIIVIIMNQFGCCWTEKVQQGYLPEPYLPRFDQDVSNCIKLIFTLVLTKLKVALLKCPILKGRNNWKQHYFVNYKC